MDMVDDDVVGRDIIACNEGNSSDTVHMFYMELSRAGAETTYSKNQIACTCSLNVLYIVLEWGKENREKFEPLIIKYIKPGNTIISESWGNIT